MNLFPNLIVFQTTHGAPPPSWFASADRSHSLPDARAVSDIRHPCAGSHRAGETDEV